MRLSKSLTIALLIALLSIALIAFAQKPAAAPARGASAQGSGSSGGVDEAAMDKTVQPCDDFFQYACGSWLKQHPIPSDQSRYGRFNELFDRNQDVLHDILEKAAANTSGRTPLDTKIGDFYASCMNEDAINKAGIAPLKPELDRIDALKGKDELAGEVAHLYTIGVPTLFSFRATQDYKDATQMIANVDQGGIGLPDRDYYVKDDPKTTETRNLYAQHVQKMLQLAGEQEPQAATDAKAVMDIETALAKASLQRVARREPTNVYHKMSRQQFEALSPAFSWDKFLTGVNAPAIQSLNVGVPEFVKAVQTVVASEELPAIKAYLRWHAINSTAALLSSDFVQEQFNFDGKTLRGTPEIEPRWKRCVRFTDRGLGELLGQPYVERRFGPDAKQRTLRMVQEIEAAMQQDINTLPWMTEATKKEALVKLHAVANKIGYPDKWKDYSSVTVKRDDALGNLLRANAFETHRNVNKIGKAVDKQEWGMTPPTVNAYYSPTQNNINFPAGILQPPFYDKSRNDAVNYGGVGAVVGHELTHGFDDQGRKFDPQGNLRDWWTAQDASEFDKRAGCEVEEYSSFSPVEGVNLNGKLTLGENTADNGGLRLAYMAMEKALAGKDKGAQGFTPEQLFFLGWGQIWCEHARPEVSRLLAQTDPHSPGQFRVNGVVRNMPEFRQAFGCKAGQKMAPENACRVW